ncbi:hypothetical protein [Metabacillus fastidiosus]|uniref:hypothetical protein n=1 Tax=Metabacillus fastidiosus TaxID=1458 RepID=UPI00082708D0|nr:hypothetical protein [Metabacillus fastidiosus]MED4461849.1 hypothetical protein [Metabacillus fastidiosus]
MDKIDHIDNRTICKREGTDRFVIDKTLFFDSTIIPGDQGFVDFAIKEAKIAFKEGRKVFLEKISIENKNLTKEDVLCFDSEQEFEEWIQTLYESKII